MRILLIEDNPDHAAIIREDICEAFHGDVAIATYHNLADGLEALKSEEEFDTVLFDLNLPDSKADATIKRVSSIDMGLPMIALTSINDDFYAKELLNKGIQDYLTKDQLSPQQILKTINYALERKKVEKVLKQELEERKLFCRSLSHDFNGPLRRLEFLTHALINDNDSQLSEDGRSFVQSMKKQVDYMQSLVTGLESYLRLNFSDSDLVPTCLREVLELVVDSHSDLLKKKNAKVVIEDCLPVVAAEKSRLMLLFQNLILNAIKYNNSEQPQVIIGAVTEGPWAKIAVTDNGIGINAKEIQELFSPFYRATNAAGFEGIGLGLAIVQRIVSQFRGHISVTSEEGKGSTFLVSLPIDAGNH